MTKRYMIPENLSDFQRLMYMHLIDWKWEHITKNPGQYAGRDYDAVLPAEYQGKLPHLYEPVKQMFLDHQKRFHFKTHKFADHVASSQIACANLFLPVMAHPDVAPMIFAPVKPDMVSIATEELDHGFRIEFWDENPNGTDAQTGMLGDHNRSAGTDSDFAIAYRNHAGQLCLWLIEHKLTEAEFTTCGGAKSKGRKYGNYACDSTADVLANPDLCYYHGKCHYNYWPITLANEATFPRKNLLSHAGCPFKGGMNQLWRNMVLALAIENATEGPYAKYQKVYFSVCHHPWNTALNDSMTAFRSLLGDKNKFSSFTSEPLISAALEISDLEIKNWADWYSDLYLGQ